MINLLKIKRVANKLVKTHKQICAKFAIKTERIGRLPRRLVERILTYLRFHCASERIIFTQFSKNRWFGKKFINNKNEESNKINLCRKKVWQDPCYFLAFGFGSGLIRKAPGTFGTIAALPVYLLISHLACYLYLLISISFFIIGIFISDIVSKDLGVDDYSGIVWDEIVGYLFVMLLVPVNFTYMLLGFILFRIFDIWKPAPIRYFDEKIKGGLGVMIDDLIAAVYAWIILQIIIRMIHV